MISISGGNFTCKMPLNPSTALLKRGGKGCVWGNTVYASFISGQTHSQQKRYIPRQRNHAIG